MAEILEIVHEKGEAALPRRILAGQRDALGADAEGDAALPRGFGGMGECRAPEAQRAGALDRRFEQVDAGAAEEGRDAGVGRAVIDLVRGADLQDLAGLHERDAAGHGHRLHLVVGDIDEGGAEAAVQIGKLAAHMDAQARIEIGERLVHQEDLRLAHHGAAEGGALALAAGELAGAAVEERLDLQELGDTAHGLVDLAGDAAAARREAADERQAFGEERAVDHQRRGDVLPHGHVRVERVGLEDHGDAALAGAEMIDHALADAHAARSLRLQPRDDAQKGGLAAARGADERHELAVVHIERDIAQDLRGAECLDDVAKLDTRHGAPSRTGPRREPP